MRATDFDELAEQSEKNRPPYQRGYEAGHHDGLAAGMGRASEAYDRGYEAAYREMWRVILLDEADQLEAGIRATPPDWFGLSDAEALARPAQLRAWAKEAS